MLRELLIEIHNMELLFITNMHIVYDFLCQLLFLTMYKIVFLDRPNGLITLNEQQHIIAELSPLPFCSIFIGKIKDVCTTERSRTVEINYSFLSYIKWILKIILEWAQIIALVLCVAHKGTTYKPDTFYTTFAFSYYICTERFVVDLLIKLVSYFQFSFLDWKEHLYIPILLNLYVMFCAVRVESMYLAKSWHLTYVLFSCYFLLYLRFKDLYFNYIKKLMFETHDACDAPCRCAAEGDLQKWDGIFGSVLEQYEQCFDNTLQSYVSSNLYQTM